MANHPKPLPHTAWQAQQARIVLAELIGGGLDEAPQAYKDIRQVMASQRGLVDVLGSFTPKIVRMDGA